MKTFNEFLYESFDTKPANWTKLPLRKNNKDKFVYVYSFYIPENSTNYTVFITQIDDNYYSLDFAQVEQINFNKFKYKFDREGTGMEFKVFATILDIVKYHINKYKTLSKLEIASNANDPKRAQLYKKIIKKYLPNNWSIQKFSSKVRKSSAGEDYLTDFYTLVKNK